MPCPLCKLQENCFNQCKENVMITCKYENICYGPFTEIAKMLKKITKIRETTTMWFQNIKKLSPGAHLLLPLLEICQLVSCCKIKIVLLCIVETVSWLDWNIYIINQTEAIDHADNSCSYNLQVQDNLCQSVPLCRLWI